MAEAWYVSDATISTDPDLNNMRTLKSSVIREMKCQWMPLQSRRKEVKLEEVSVGSQNRRWRSEAAEPKMAIAKTSMAGDQ